ncbi:GDP-L-fucose synthase [Alphaproteobacteria bacterium]|nr:GDP-L-fucose synthase [Alphaproteobacteria bacterium]
MNKDTKIFIAGHNGMVGSSLLRILKKKGFNNLIYFNRNKVDFENQKQTINIFKKTMPDVLLISAAKVGGIYANNEYPYEFIYKNLLIELNLIEAANICNVKKLIFLGSSCAYPKHSRQPIKENNLLSGFLEFTNRPYAIAKIAGIELCASLNRQNKKKFLSVMPCNLYGPNDNYDLNNSHVLPALIKKIDYAKKNNSKHISVWGSGKPLREFMHVDDLSDCIIHILNLNDKKFKKLLNLNDFSLVNIGSGEEISIFNLAKKISKVLGFKGQIKLDKRYPDGTPRKILNIESMQNFGWKSKIKLDEGIYRTYKNYLENN